MRLSLAPMSLREAGRFIDQFHRHHAAPQGGLFALAAMADGAVVVGVAIIGRPLARALQDGFTAEITRLCALPEAPRNTCSFLYGRAWRAWQAHGGKRMVTYTLASESGASLRGAGWRLIGEVGARDWFRERSPGATGHRQQRPVYEQLKLRWEAANP
jgi:hypothetical protein